MPFLLKLRATIVASWVVLSISTPCGAALSPGLEKNLKDYLTEGYRKEFGYRGGHDGDIKRFIQDYVSRFLSNLSDQDIQEFNGPQGEEKLRHLTSQMLKYFLVQGFLTCDQYNEVISPRVMNPLLDVFSRLGRDKPVKVVSVGQMHWRPEYDEALRYGRNDVLDQNIEMISKSQMEAAQYILKTKDPIVFNESLPFNIRQSDLNKSPEEYRKSSYIQNKSKSNLRERAYTLYEYKLANEEISREFRGSFPKDFKDLTPQQRLLLARHGAPLVLLSLGKIKEMRGTSYISVTDDIYKEMKKEIREAYAHPGREENQDQSSGRMRVVDDVRELLAVQRVKNYLKNRRKDDNRTPLLFYGSGHDFARYFGPEDKIPVNFERVETHAPLEALSSPKEEPHTPQELLEKPQPVKKKSNTIQVSSYPLGDPALQTENLEAIYTPISGEALRAKLGEAAAKQMGRSLHRKIFGQNVAIGEPLVDAYGQTRRVSFEGAKKACLELNDPKNRRDVENAALKRETLLTEIRGSETYSSEEEKERALYDVHFKNPINGCYLMSSEEWGLLKLDAKKHQGQTLQQILPKMDAAFWSSSPDPDYPGSARIFYGNRGEMGSQAKFDLFSARCACSGPAEN